MLSSTSPNNWITISSGITISGISSGTYTDHNESIPNIFEDAFVDEIIQLEKGYILYGYSVDDAEVIACSTNPIKESKGEVLWFSARHLAL